MKKYRYIILTIVTLLFASCGEEYLDVNTDPSNPANAPIEFVFPAAVTTTAGTTGGFYAILGGIWSQYYTQNNASSQYRDIEGFYLEPADFQLQWQELYSGALNDYKVVKQKSATSKDWGFYLMATVMEAYTYQVLVDLYDKIPFSEATRAESGLVYAKFDDGQSIYDSLIVRIDNALAKDFSAPTVKNAGNADLVFGGDIEKWIEFANTLKLKIYLRQSEARPSVAQAGIASLYASGAKFLTSNAHLDVFVDEASKSNPMFEMDQRQLNTTQNLKASKTFFDFLTAYDDPRLDIVYTPQLNSKGEPLPQKAMNQGDFNIPSTQLDPLTVSRARIKATDPVYFISTAESYFLQAEAAERGWATGGTAAAKTLYDQGVIAAFDEVGLDGSDFIAPGGNYEYGFYKKGNKIGSIIVQKWASFATTKQGIEALFERNRTGFPVEKPNNYYTAGWEPGDIVYPKEGTTVGRNFARRLFYPESEVNRNPNTPPQVNLTDKVWWDVN